mgnify:CR=1 FL=1
MHVGTSLDQYYVQKFGKDTPIPSMQLSIEPVDQSGGCAYGYACVYTDTISWASPTEPLPMVRDPRMVFELLFGAGGTAAQRAERRATDKSILDMLTQQMASLRKAVSPADRRRLDQASVAEARLVTGGGALFNDDDLASARLQVQCRANARHARAEHDGAVDGIHKGFGRHLVFGHDGVGVMGAIMLDMLDGLFQPVHHSHRDDGVQIFGVPILFCRCLDSLINSLNPLIASYFTTGI